MGKPTMEELISAIGKDVEFDECPVCGAPLHSYQLRFPEDAEAKSRLDQISYGSPTGDVCFKWNDKVLFVAYHPTIEGE